jgi:molybdopterin synthase catalytic subunit/molybdopterin converting factor small subunit
MKIRLLAFASAGDALGAGEMDLDVPAGTTVQGLRAWLDERRPALAPLWPRLAVAVDGAVAGPAVVLSEGAEVALLPPVSGGAGNGGDGSNGSGGGNGGNGEDPPPLSSAISPQTPPSPPGVTAPWVELVDRPIDAQEVMARVASAGCGAVLLFLGTVRDRAKGSPEGGTPRPVLHLTYSAYRPMALDKLARIARDLEAAAAGELRVTIVHRLGRVALGEASVAIAVAAPHRAAAYDASRRALERLKSEVPIWKLESYADGEAVWREEEPLLERA